MKTRQLLEFVAAQLPNLPHIQTELKNLADRIEKCEAHERIAAEAQQALADAKTAEAHALVEEKE
jgi:hypothetical protein